MGLGYFLVRLFAGRKEKVVGRCLLKFASSHFALGWKRSCCWLSGVLSVVAVVGGLFSSASPHSWPCPGHSQRSFFLSLLFLTPVFFCLCKASLFFRFTRSRACFHNFSFQVFQNFNFFFKFFVQVFFFCVRSSGDARWVRGKWPQWEAKTK